MAEAMTERERLRSLVADYCVGHGVADLTLRGVGQAIGSNNRMLLYYFETKEALIVEALGEAMSRFSQFEGVFAALEDESTTLTARVTSAWKAISAAPNLPYLRLFFEVFGLAAQYPERFGPFMETVGNEWTERVGRSLSKGGIPKPQARVLARQLVALWRGLQFDLIASGKRQAINKAYDDAVEGFVIRAEAAGFSAPI